MTRIRQTTDQSMEILLYSFEGSMELHEWFRRLEEYSNYARFQGEQDKTFTTMLHLTGQAYTWATRICEYRGTNFPWNTLEELKEELELEEKWNFKKKTTLQAKYYNSIKEEDPPDEEMDKESDEDNDGDFNSDNYEDCHKEEDYIHDKQLNEGYENYDKDPDEDSDEECDFESEDNGHDRDAEEDHEDKDEEDQVEEGFPELEPPPTSDNEDKTDETLEDNIVELKGKDDISNIPTSNQPKKPKEHEDGEGDHIIHVDDYDDGEMD
eukprot:Gb_14138 [translate_table: standard]